MYPDFKKFLSRDYFGRSVSSLSGSFAPQGLFRPARFISILIFCATGIISAGRFHLYLALFLHRDYFGRPDSSLSCSFVPQGLFRPARFISILLFFSTGIISTGRFHPYLALFLHRDYFGQPDSSLSCSFSPQGLFPPPGCISSLLFCSAGIISTGQMHLYLALFLHRDYFGRPDSSLSSSFSPQGLFRSARFISILLFFFTGIISAARIHPYLAFFLHRDYFGQPDSSLSCSFSPQGLFRPAGFISILLFFSTGIISAGRIHLYLALFLHRDYFGQPDSSLSCSFSSQGLFRPAGFISILLFYSAGIISPRSDTSPLAENISARPFRQFKFVLLGNAAMICSFLLYFESKPFYIKRLPYIAKTMYRSLFCQNHVPLFRGSRTIVPVFLVSFRSMIL